MSRFTNALGFPTCPNCCDRCHILEARQLNDPEFWDDKERQELASYMPDAFEDPELVTLMESEPELAPLITRALALVRQNS